MERLTYRLKTGEVLMATEYEGKYTKDEWIGMLQCCLAAYEDLRLTPEEITAMQHTLDEYHKVADPLLRAQADGRLVVMPCKVGDTVYRLFAGNPDNPVIATLKINTVAEAVKLIGKMGMHKYIGTFLTREEAEKALKTKEG